ncbi:hypothetical protein E0W78_06935 [Aeromicrobium sp. IC_218]|nr:hypothetical protein E0W78_06935 [Aeromicrobium sp. IC_218]
MVVPDALGVDARLLALGPAELALLVALVPHGRQHDVGPLVLDRGPLGVGGGAGAEDGDGRQAGGEGEGGEAHGVPSVVGRRGLSPRRAGASSAACGSS